jgi:uncharacterized protein
MPDAVAVAVFAKAPVAGYAKTRLIPRLGAEGAAALQNVLIDRAVATALAARIGPVALWCAPDAKHPCFQEAARRSPIALAGQPDGDLGARMLAAFRASGGPLVLIGTDCPTLTPADLRDAADALRHGADVVLSPAEDGGYGLISALCAYPCLFEAMPWSTAQVARLTAERARSAGLRLKILRKIWDIDTPADLDRLLRSGLLTPEKEAGLRRSVVAAGQQRQPTSILPENAPRRANLCRDPAINRDQFTKPVE